MILYIHFFNCGVYGPSSQLKYKLHESWAFPVLSVYSPGVWHRACKWRQKQSIHLPRKHHSNDTHGCPQSRPLVPLKLTLWLFGWGHRLLWEDTEFLRISSTSQVMTPEKETPGGRTSSYKGMDARKNLPTSQVCKFFVVTKAST